MGGRNSSCACPHMRCAVLGLRFSASERFLEGSRFELSWFGNLEIDLAKKATQA